MKITQQILCLLFLLISTQTYSQFKIGVSYETAAVKLFGIDKNNDNARAYLSQSSNQFSGIHFSFLKNHYSPEFGLGIGVTNFTTNDIRISDNSSTQSQDIILLKRDLRFWTLPLYINFGNLSERSQILINYSMSFFNKSSVLTILNTQTNGNNMRLANPFHFYHALSLSVNTCYPLGHLNLNLAPFISIGSGIIETQTNLISQFSYGINIKIQLRIPGIRVVRNTNKKSAINKKEKELKVKEEALKNKLNNKPLNK